MCLTNKMGEILVILVVDVYHSTVQETPTFLWCDRSVIEPRFNKATIKIER